MECALMNQPSVIGRALLGRTLLDRTTKPVAPTFSFGWTFGVRHILYGVVEQILLDQPLLDHPLLDRATRPVAPTFVWWTLLNCVLTKCQTKGSTMPFLAPKYDLVDSEGLLERFAKYRLMQTGALERHFGGCWERMGVLFLFSVPNGSLFITFRFVDTAHLLEKETRCFCVSFSKDLTSGRETIVFGR